MTPDRGAVLRAAALVSVGSLGVQSASALSSTLFDVLGPSMVSALRLIPGALILLVVARPRLRGWTRAQWRHMVSYGLAMTAMNQFPFASIDRIPLGIAVTLEFLGPCAVALLAARGFREAASAVLAFVGVVLIMHPGGALDPMGVIFALGAAASFALYTVGAARVGRSVPGIQGVTLSVILAAIISFPLAIMLRQGPRLIGTSAVTEPWSLTGLAPSITGAAVLWGTLTIAAALGVALPYAVDTLAGRLTSARIVGILFALDPIFALLIGWVALNQRLDPLSLLGIIITLTGCLLLLARSRRSENHATTNPT
ncbi:EamA family transporter [Mycetocola saprophilus]|uniref:EamA family transporter n=1 Tax=Mycetocola saprophilus TaxID=76636 RepID=UPI003BF07A2E